MWDDDRAGPVEDYRAGLPMVVELLRELAYATGARLFVDGGVMTDASLDEVIDLLA